MTRVWGAASATQTGSSHIRDGKPGQDAHRSWSDGSIAVISVADGHGHHSHFRSERGAALATQVASSLFQAAVTELGDPGHAESLLRSDIGPALVEGWTRAVLDDVRAHPYAATETGLMAGDSVQDMLTPYGSTILAMAATQRVLAVLQIGDGDSVAVTDQGDILQPLPTDDELVGVLTTSLCQPAPLESLRCAALGVDDLDLVLAYACTDGFGSARLDAEGWKAQVGTELLGHVREHGVNWVAEKLPTWLEEPAQTGGDDATLALIADSRGPR